MSYILEVQYVSRQFGGLIAVNELSFGIEAGSINALIGPNGAGKTTLFNLITGQISTSSGNILFENTSVQGLQPYQRVKLGLARTFQATILYNDSTVFENVLRSLYASHPPSWKSYVTGLRSFVEYKDKQIIRANELLDFVNLLPFKNNLAKNLAYGHQKALGIAIGLSSSPKVFMLDEPVAGMNAGESEQISNLIRKINKSGVTVLVVEHDMNFVMSLCKNIIVINNGKKIAEGSPEEIQNNPDVIAAYLGAEDA
jgi:branched-chain amino acid transport system ATP-binding protein